MCYCPPERAPWKLDDRYPFNEYAQTELCTPGGAKHLQHFISVRHLHLLSTALQKSCVTFLHKDTQVQIFYCSHYIMLMSS